MELLPPQFQVLLDSLKQQISENYRQIQQVQSNQEALRSYTQTQIDQLRGWITQLQDQNRNFVDQSIDKARTQTQKEWEQLRKEVGVEIQYVNNDIHELTVRVTKLQDVDLKELRKLIEDTNKDSGQTQKEWFQRVIAAQWAILFFLFTTAIGILVKIFWH